MLLTWLDQKTVAAAAAGNHPERLRSCGKSTYSVRLAIMDDEGHLLPPNQTGEIVARGSLVTPGYHNLPQATADIRKYGWHHTGDVGYQDEDGFFYIVDRKKDMIISGGFNIYPSDLEAVLRGHAAVADVAVIGVPSEQWGETPVAFVVRRAGDDTSAESLLQWTNAQLGKTQRLARLQFIDELPRSAIGKVLKRELRELEPR
jgi:acyl-CoA synthetase (AMP-forming)/AMP-acid ligase II